MKIKPYSKYGGSGAVVGYMHWCPACEDVHALATTERNHNGAIWRFDGNLDKPTFSPSIRCYVTEEDGTQRTICHYHIKDGMIEFCNDNPHALNGQTVELPDYPERQD